MILTNFSMTAVRSSRNRATRESFPPLRFTEKPKRRENTIKGSMARRLSRPTKSLAVKKLTIMSARVAYSPSSSAGRSVQAVSTGG